MEHAYTTWHMSYQSDRRRPQALYDVFTHLVLSAETVNSVSRAWCSQLQEERGLINKTNGNGCIGIGLMKSMLEVQQVWRE